MPDSVGFVFVRHIYASVDGRVVLLTHPTKICHWSRFHNVRHKGSPQFAEGINLNGAFTSCFHCRCVKSPDTRLGVVGWQQFDVKPLISRDSARQHQGMGFRKVDEKCHDSGYVGMSQQSDICCTPASRFLVSRCQSKLLVVFQQCCKLVLADAATTNMSDI